MRQVRPGPLRRTFLLALAAAALCRGADQVEYTAYYVWDDLDNSVATTSFSMAKTFWQGTLGLLDVALDQINVPPLTQAKVDGISGASRPRRNATRAFQKSRGQIIAGLEQPLGADTRISGSYYFSQEVDYGSQAAIASLTQELFQKNLTLTLTSQYTADDVGELTQAGDLINRFKETHQASLTAIQLLSPTTLVKFGGDGYRQKGFLSDPYQKSVHPSERWRQAGWAEIAQYLTGLEGSISLNYRYYWDDWDVESHTVRLKLNKYLSQDWIFSPSYRYYTQTAASFADNPESAEFHTQDYKLEAFEGNTMGAEVAWYLRSLGRKRKSLDFLGSSSLHLMYFRYFRSSGPARPADNAMQARLNFSY